MKVLGWLGCFALVVVGVEFRVAAQEITGKIPRFDYFDGFKLNVDNSLEFFSLRDGSNNLTRL